MADIVGQPTEPLVLVLITAPTIEIGRTISTALVNENLAACVNIGNGSVTSVYRWDGKIQEDSEVLMYVKTRRELFPKLAARVKVLHPYKVPEIIAIPICLGLTEYTDWVARETADAAAK